MTNIEALVQANKLALQDIFLYAVREQMKGLGATSVIWHQDLSEDRTYTDVVGPFLVIDRILLIPQKMHTSLSDDRNPIVYQELRKKAKDQSYDHIHKNKKGGVRANIVDLDISNLLEILDESEGLGFAFGDENFIWVTQDSYFKLNTDLFGSFD